MQRTHDSDLIRLVNITHRYAADASNQAVLHDVSFSVRAGQSCAIVGASGSGKSTLLNLMGLLDEPASGRVLLAGKDMTHADAGSRAVARNRMIGFVFQSFNLLPRFNVLDNVAVPLLYRGVSQLQARQAALMQLDRVGLHNVGHRRPADISGGQRQRVAIARALVGEPSLLLADEPTGNLDSQTAQDIIELLLSLNRECGTTLIVVTHDIGIADRMARCIQVCDGRIEGTGHA